ncbi:alpha/beta fold hydrolase [Spongiactinospora rosea]|uniref:alpha/beta fold hydrolase n=1 Tax=Spongiactinospora rosea TaxID=2248750 RepID=UPI001314F23D|nr:alpha/beta fold hydrolase [Spongiactinospora rosea]
MAQVEGQQTLFVHGAGQGAHAADGELVARLRQALGPGHEIHYPAMPDEHEPDHAKWKQRIIEEMASMSGPLVLIGHSLGGSVLVKCLAEIEPPRPIAALVLMAAPMWGGDGWRYDGGEQFEPPHDTAARLPQETPIHVYHCRDDEVVPFAHLGLYAELLPQATTSAFDEGGHQLHGVEAAVAADLAKLPAAQ